MKAPFYTTTTTLCDGEVEITDDILNLPGTIKENMSHYYLGYISDEQMPTLWHMGTLTLENGVMRGSIIHQNYGWGYIWHWGDSDSTNVALMRGALIYEDNDVKTNKVSTYSQHFVNKCTIANANSENLFRIFFGLMPVKETELTPDGTSMRGYYAGHYNQFFYKAATLTAEQIDQFVNGTYTVTLTGVQMGGGSYTVSFTGTDFDEETRICKITGISTYDQNITLYVCISYATTYGMQAYLADNNTKYASRLAPFFAADIVGNEDNIPDQTVLLAPNNMSNKSFILAQANFDAAGTSIDSVQFLVGSPAYTGNLGKTAMGDYSYADGLTIEDFYQHRMVNGTDTITPNWWYATSGIVRNKYIIAGAANSMMAQVVCPLPLSDLTKITVLSLNKIETAAISVTAPTSFTCSQTYTTDYSVAMYDVDTTDSLGIRKSENYADISAELLNWQQPGNDITINEFTEDDIPEWEPPEPGEDEDGDGDTILPPSISGIGDLSGFVTMYALKDDQLSNLGNTLWSSFTDANFWNSVSVVLSNTTSIDPSTILNYIVSIRLFPFNLATVEGASPELPEIFFGRGLVGLLLDSTLSSRIYILNKCVTRIDGGVLDVPAKYGDFRDMEPCAKMILHVPFAGSCEINPSQVVGKHLALSYSIDYCTGAFMAQCFVGGDGLSMSYPVATLYGQLGATVQLSASNEMESLQCLAGATLGLATGAMNGIAGAISGAAGVATSLSNNRALPHTTGKSAGFSSFFEPRVPYIEIIYDKYYVPDNYAHTHGYACDTVSKIGDLHGYTVCRNVDTTGLSCETDERLSIKRILESGFFVD